MKYLVSALSVLIALNLMLTLDNRYEAKNQQMILENQAQYLELNRSQLGLLSRYSTSKTTKTPQNTPETTEEFNGVSEYLEGKGSPLSEFVPLLFDILEPEQAFRLLAISGVESNFGTDGFIATDCFNAWGYLYTGTEIRGCYSSKWGSWEDSIKRFAELEENNYLSGFNLEVYCQSECTYWFSNYDYFIGVFENIKQ